ncbi:protein phosphatase 1 regulatory subunit 1B isoform X5 [Syngnathus typhle]|uniref:protein phosphatase 1 regulatory subunit 1B isoform X5 n=1 Tax=Syngnathus typhle TaxID=161592 RepID=UPI002A6B5CFA|nr:protein phosphatase 1 regulatory subunit 1B isoform X5 [Syngnathus typhle]
MFFFFLLNRGSISSFGDIRESKSRHDAAFPSGLIAFVFYFPCRRRFKAGGADGKAVSQEGGAESKGVGVQVGRCDTKRGRRTICVKMDDENRQRLEKAALKFMNSSQPLRPQKVPPSSHSASCEDRRTDGRTTAASAAATQVERREGTTAEPLATGGLLWSAHSARGRPISRISKPSGEVAPILFRNHGALRVVRDGTQRAEEDPVRRPGLGGPQS